MPVVALATSFPKIFANSSKLTYSVENKTNSEYSSPKFSPVYATSIDIPKKFESLDKVFKVEQEWKGVSQSLELLISKCPNTLFKKDSEKTQKDEEKLKRSLTLGEQLSSYYIKIPRNLKKTMKYYYFIITGKNNPDLVRSIMSLRPSWKEQSNKESKLYNFKWKETSPGYDFNTHNKGLKQMTNHYEFNCSISNKSQLFVSLMKYCEENGQDVLKYVPLTIFMLFENGAFEAQFENFTYLFYDIMRYYYKPEFYRGHTINIPTYYSMFSLGTYKKLGLGKKTQLYVPSSHYHGDNIWIIKAPNLNCGRCIRLAKSVEEIKSTIKIYQTGISNEVDRESKVDEKQKKEEADLKKKAKTQVFVKKDSILKYNKEPILLQKYIERPLLYNGRKFDIRVWVLINHLYDIYFFKEGHIKTSSYSYDPADKNIYVHLTNYSVQKTNNFFGTHEEGNTLSFKELDNYLKESKEDVKLGRIIERMKYIIQLCFKSVRNELNAKDRSNCFELFGFDFMVDYLGNVFLLEVNTNPGIEVASSIHKVLLPRLIDDVLKLTIDIEFPPTLESSSKAVAYEESVFPVEGYSNNESMFEFMFNLKSN